MNTTNNKMNQEINKEMINEDFENIWLNATDDQKNQVVLAFNGLNVGNRNAKRVENFGEKIINKKHEKKITYNELIMSNSVNGIIWGPTQLGKSQATIEGIKIGLKNDISCIVSSDNKTDQQEQLFGRIEKELILSNVTLIKISDRSCEKTLKKCIIDGTLFVLFVLDNSNQIEKLIQQLAGNYQRHEQMKKMKKIIIFQDEADVITKDSDIETINYKQAESHQKWLELIKHFSEKMPCIDLKRIFITATPENVILLYKIYSYDVMCLEIPEGYTGFDKIENIDTKPGDIEINLKKEVDRIKNEKTYEAILICHERTTKEQHKLLEILSITNDCISNTYNGNGITASIPEYLQKKFIDLLKVLKINPKMVGNFFRISLKDINISLFYTICKKIGENCVITIGKDLICRGISYVGTERGIDANPITATILFYTTSKTMNMVGICQIIGRITGCAMLNLKRKIYCNKEIFEEYITYNRNQRKYMKLIENSVENILTSELMDANTFEKIKRSVDRPKLELNINMEESDSDTEYEIDEPNKIDGVEINKLKRRINGKTLVGRMIKCLYENENIMTMEEFKEKIKYEKTNKEFINNIDNGRGIKTLYGKLWNYKNNTIDLNRKIREFIKTKI
jgi:hypothetical protein